MTKVTEYRRNAKGFLLPLQGLRTIAFTAIFLSHARIGDFGCLGAWGVSIFFVLSGFVMLYSYYNRETVLKPFDFGFVYHKINKLYPLHIATMMVCVFYEFYGVILGNRSVFHLLQNIFLHITLTQVWIPKQAYFQTLNGLAWYLAVCAVLYLAFPSILRVMRRMNKRSCTILLFVLFSFQVLVSFFAFCFGNADRSAWFSMQWITYYCPLSRLLDFAIGCCLGWLFLHTERTPPPTFVSGCLEAVVLIGIVVSWMIYARNISVFSEEYIKYVLLFTLTTVPLIWMTARGGGILAHALSCKPLVDFAELTPYTFLIHGVVLKYCHLIIGRLTGSNYFIAAAALVITIAAAYVWIAISKNMRHIKQAIRLR